MLWVIAAATAAPLATCARTFDASALTTSVDAAERAFTNLDSAALAEAKGEAERRLVCIGERLDPLLIARVHRMEALSAFVVGEQSRVAQALAGALLADPGHEIPTSLVPEEHAIREQRRYATQLLKDGLPRPLVTMPSGWFEVDGDGQHSLSTSHAGVVQQIDGQGAVVETRYVWPEDDLGAWDGSKQVATPSTTSVASTGSSDRHVTPYLGLTGGFFGASAPTQGSSPGAFGGGTPAADLGLVVPIGQVFGVVASVGYGFLPETRGGVSARMGRIHAGAHFRLGRGGVELGPTAILSNFSTTDYTAKGFAGGLTAAGDLRLLTAGPVGFGLRADLSGLTAGGMFITWLDVGLNLTWEGTGG